MFNLNNSTPFRSQTRKPAPTAVKNRRPQAPAFEALEGRVQFSAAPLPLFGDVEVTRAAKTIDAGNSRKSAALLGDFTNDSVTYKDSVSKRDQDFFKFTTDGPQVLTAKLTNLRGKANLQILDAKGRVLGVAKATSTGQFVTGTVAPGTYFLQVSPKAKAATGYTLGLTLADPATPLPGNVFTGQLDGDDAKLDDGMLYDRWVVAPNEDGPITLRLDSFDFDAKLAVAEVDLETGERTLIDFDDDSAGGLSASITFTAAAGQGFVVYVMPANAAQSGQYTLTVSPESAEVLPLENNSPA